MLTRPRLQLRLARSADAAALARLSRREVEAGRDHAVWHERRVRASIRDGETVALVAELDERIAGFAIMRFGTFAAHLHLMAVAAEHRRCGIGRQLLGWLTQSARTAGIGAIHLEVPEQNEDACRFYTAMGYEVRDRVPGYYGGEAGALRLVRRLAPPAARDA
jgi:ribosomal protein S18 acetylase RimI-like enzyme